MGHKVHPSGMRTGLFSDWSSKWFASKGKYADFLIEDLKIRADIHKQFDQAGIERIEIKRNANLIEIEIKTAKPGVIIGRSGAGAKNIKNRVEQICLKDKPGGEKMHVRISIVEAGNPDLSAQLIAENIAKALEKRVNVRRAVSQALERAKENGADGVKIKVSGRLNGADIARSEFVNYGSVPLSTFKAEIKYAMIHAWTTYGIIGVKVWIYKSRNK